ncbi:MAG: ABC transporter ATP-binding protein [Oscillospiraceae bacterium]|nr:ABC transporter ATP-binding protein [Oscillospiraceae bacterium]
MKSEVLRMENITKIYTNGFIASKDVTFSVHEGEVHALVGENGAGKTTLMKILFGMEQPQGGKIFINGKEENIDSPISAIKKGIGMVHQHFMQVPSLTVAENVVLGMEPMKGLHVDIASACRMTQEISDKYKLQVNANDRICDLSVSLKQKVEILKALIRGAKILILDEPTAVLTPQETEELFDQIKILKQHGHAIIFISHKLEEVMQLCDRVTVLRHGRVIGTEDIENLTQIKLSRMMVGRDVVLKIDKEDPKPKKDVVQVRNVTYINDEGRKVIDDVSFTIRAGEILGIAGVEGNGQSEFSDIISGMLPFVKGSIIVNDTEIKGKSIRQIRDLGVAHISEDRMKFGCAGELSVRENIISDRVNKKEFKSGPFINTKRVNALVDECIKEFEIACDDREQPVRMLSGGNIQKVVIAREFTSGANIIIANQPTRGIDVGTTEMIRTTLIKKSRKEGVAALLVSADLNEVLEVSDRLLVMRKGKVVAHFKKANEIPEDLLGEYMLGLRCMTAEEMGDL